MKDIDLKELTIADIELVRQWRNSEEVSKYMYTDAHIAEEEQQKWFEKVSADKSQKYWVIEYEGRKLGLASVYSIKPAFKSCYWAFYLGDTSVRGAGIGSKVEYNVLSKVFDEMNFNKLLCEVFVFNDAVIKMHEKFGFKRESYFREHICKNEQFYDVVGLSMLKKEWDTVKEYHKNKIYNSER
ncbi:MAG TPA: UDP-4-amino-4,6-dideoxy-N-acetyl-beta-L-altrosamine N-acetyltransferase [Flavipsychrobacter sp.]|nr:UDP-4-amino-4,6-dideoxy-N-acetyl-beta-L-altrosamine N-acetyltransferase [Flavipsychrobacter sp.]